jgi:hypothetical protein
MAQKLKIKPEYIYISLIVILATFFFVLSFRWVEPNIKVYSKLSSSLKNMDKELQIRQATIQQIHKLNMEFSDIEKEYQGFIKKMNLEPAGMETVKVITDTAEDLKLEFLSLTPMPLKKIMLTKLENKTSAELLSKKGLYNFIWEAPLSVKMKADFANLLDFLQRIEEGKRFMRIGAIRITKDAATPFVHNVSLVVSMYCLPGGEEAR